MARVFTCEIPTTVAPDLLRAWWTDGVPRDREFVAKFRGPLGMPIRVRETFRVRSDGSWGFETHAPFGLDVHDDFHVSQTAHGIVMRVRCVVSARNFIGKLALPFYFPMARRQFVRQWIESADECARDLGYAPSVRK